MFGTNLKRNFPKFVVAPANYYDWRAQNQVFSALGAYVQNTFNLASMDGEPERYLGASSDRGCFDALQVSPVLGRIFTDEEDQPGRDGVIILSYGIWRSRFGGDPKIVGQTLTLHVSVGCQDLSHPTSGYLHRTPGSLHTRGATAGWFGGGPL
jgi:MacB-like periplasmic core domain